MGVRLGKVNNWFEMKNQIYEWYTLESSKKTKENQNTATKLTHHSIIKCINGSVMHVFIMNKK